MYSKTSVTRTPIRLPWLIRTLSNPKEIFAISQENKCLGIYIVKGIFLVLPQKYMLSVLVRIVSSIMPTFVGTQISCILI